MVTESIWNRLGNEEESGFIVVNNTTIKYIKFTATFF